MRRAIVILVIAGLAGCRGPRPTEGGAGDGGRIPPPKEPFWTDANATKSPRPKAKGGSRVPSLETGTPEGSAQVDGVLAGRLVDEYDQAIANAIIKAVPVRADGSTGTAVPARANGDGHFIIEDLEPNTTYQLTASVSREGKRLAGVAQIRPPYTRMLMRLSEDAPPVPEEPAAPPPSPALAPREEEQPLAPAPKPEPLPKAKAKPTPPAAVPAPRQPPEPDPVPMGSAGDGGADPLLPDPNVEAEPTARADQETGDDFDGDYRPGRVRPPAPAAPPPARPSRPAAPERVAVTPDPDRAPVLNVPGPLAPRPAPPPSRRAEPVPDTELRAADLGGRPTVYDFGRQPRVLGASASARFVLLDFWSTTCTPCLRSMPRMQKLHSTYGGRGLEILGVACDRGPFADKADLVGGTVRIRRVTYPVYLLDDADEGAVERAYRVRGYPTLILLENGREVWRGVGEASLPQVETILARRLGG